MKHSIYSPYPVYGHCIKFGCNSQEVLDNLFKPKLDGYPFDKSIVEKIGEQLQDGDTNGVLKVDNIKVEWQVVVFSVNSDWSLDGECDEDTNGVFNSLDKAKQKLNEVVKEDIENDDTHRYVVEGLGENACGKFDGYIIDKEDDEYTIYLDGNYDDYHFSVVIKEIELN